jgi:hypothetical protein
MEEYVARLGLTRLELGRSEQTHALSPRPTAFDQISALMDHSHSTAGIASTSTSFQDRQPAQRSHKLRRYTKMPARCWEGSRAAKESSPRPAGFAVVGCRPLPTSTICCRVLKAFSSPQNADRISPFAGETPGRLPWYRTRRIARGRATQVRLRGQRWISSGTNAFRGWSTLFAHVQRCSRKDTTTPMANGYILPFCGRVLE